MPASPPWLLVFPLVLEPWVLESLHWDERAFFNCDERAFFDCDELAFFDPDGLAFFDCDEPIADAGASDSLLSLEGRKA